MRRRASTHVTAARVDNSAENLHARGGGGIALSAHLLLAACTNYLPVPRLLSRRDGRRSSRHPRRGTYSCRGRPARRSRQVLARRRTDRLNGGSWRYEPWQI